MSGPVAAMLPGGRRLHLNHGPIDLIVEAWGADEEVGLAYGQAARFFATVLDDLVAVLPALRRPVGGAAVGHGPTLRGIAAAMERAASAHAGMFVTPMAAVAGAVADGVLAAMVAGRRLSRAYVNDGGDIALYLTPGQAITAAGGPDLASRIRIGAADRVRGIATSGWRGRSHSLGIADAVTVLARSAAEADVAATLIANAVDLPGHPAVARRPARELAPDSDLGTRPVTVAVGRLVPDEVASALASGRRAAEAMLARGLIAGAALWLQGQAETVGERWPGAAAADAAVAR